MRLQFGVPEDSTRLRVFVTESGQDELLVFVTARRWVVIIIITIISMTTHVTIIIIGHSRHHHIHQISSSIKETNHHRHHHQSSSSPQSSVSVIIHTLMFSSTRCQGCALLLPHSRMGPTSFPWRALGIETLDVFSGFSDMSQAIPNINQLIANPKSLGLNSPGATSLTEVGEGSQTGGESPTLWENAYGSPFTTTSVQRWFGQ